MTLIQIETGYDEGGTLKAWPSGDTVNGVLLTEVAPGLFQGIVDDSLSAVWYGFAGTSAPTTWNDRAAGGPIKVFDLRDGIITGSAVIFVGTQVARVVGTNIIVFKDENIPVTVTLTNGSFTGLTLRFTVEDRREVDVLVIENGSISRTATTFTVTLPTTFTDTLGEYTWSIRDITGGRNVVLLHGALSVRAAASKNA
jgi:hypothetical protein